MRQQATPISAARCILQNPAQGQFYGTIGQLDDTGRANYSALLLSLQRRLKNNLSVLVELDDLEVHERSGDDRDHRADDRRTRPIRTSTTRIARPTAGIVVNLSVVGARRSFGNRRTHAVFSDWQFSPIVRWQSGNRSTVTTGCRQRPDGPGGQRAVQILDDPYGRHGPTALPQSRGICVAGERHLQHAEAVHDREPEQSPERLRPDPHVQDWRRAIDAVPVGSVQRDQPCELQCAGDAR